MFFSSSDILIAVITCASSLNLANASTSSSQGTIIQDSGTGTGTTDDPGMDEDSGTGDDANGDGLNGAASRRLRSAVQEKESV